MFNNGNFPPELTLHIFSFFNRQDLRRLAQVSKEANKLAKDFQLKLFAREMGIEEKEAYSLRTQKNIIAEEMVKLIGTYNQFMDMDGNNYRALLQQKKLSLTRMDAQIVKFFERAKKDSFQILCLDLESNVSLGACDKPLTYCFDFS